MFSKMLGTTLATKAWTPAIFFLQVGTSLNNFKHKRKKAPLPIKKMAHKRRKNSSHMDEKASVRWDKHPT